MTIVVNDNSCDIIADEGRAIRRIGGNDVFDSVSVPLSMKDGWEDCEKEVDCMKYSRWGIIKALEKRGLADAFDSYLAENKAAFRRFYGPNYFAADDSDFKAMITTLQGAFKLTDADIAAILAESPYTDD